MPVLSGYPIETPTGGRFRMRARNEVYFSGSDKPNERPGMYAFWTALIRDPKPWTKKAHLRDWCPGRARINLPRQDRFTRMPLDALRNPRARVFYRALYKSLKKPLRVRRSTVYEINRWMMNHPELAQFARCPEYRKYGVLWSKPPSQS